MYLGVEHPTQYGVSTFKMKAPYLATELSHHLTVTPNAVVRFFS